jgi:hypothetical protein
LETSFLAFCFFDVLLLGFYLCFALIDRGLVEGKGILGLGEELLGAFGLDFLN